MIESQRFCILGQCYVAYAPSPLRASIFWYRYFDPGRTWLGFRGGRAA